jgi:hypothetical protein
MAPSLRPVFIVDAVRTPIGRYGGALAGVRPDDLGAIVIREVVRRTGADPAAIDDVLLGCANQAGEDNRNVARMSALLGGLPPSVPGGTVNRLCGSGLMAVGDGARAIAVGDADLLIAGGVESMSRAPLVMAKPTAAFPRGDVAMADSTLGWGRPPSWSPRSTRFRARPRMPSRSRASGAGARRTPPDASPPRSSPSSSTVATSAASEATARPAASRPTSTRAPTPRPRRWRHCGRCFARSAAR